MWVRGLPAPWGRGEALSSLWAGKPGASGVSRVLWEPPGGTPAGGPLTGWRGLLVGNPLDLNRADPSDLEALPGIGPATAASIVRLRVRRGGFDRVEDLLAVRGVGPRVLERIRPYVTVGR